MDQEFKNDYVVGPIKKKRNLFWLWIVITAVVAGGGVGAFAYRGTIKDRLTKNKANEVQTAVDTSKKTEATSDSTSGTTTSTETSADTATSSGSATGTKIVDAGVTWVNPREKLADLNLFKKAADPNSEYVGTTYYKVATTSDGGEVILALVELSGMGSYYDFHHFMKRNNTYYWLEQNSDGVGGGASGSAYSLNNTQTDSTYALNSLRPDKKIIVGSTVLTQQSAVSRGGVVETDMAGTKVTETKWGDLYLYQGDFIATVDGNSDVKTSQYYLLRNDGIKLIYSPSPSFILDDGTFNVTWSNATGKGQKYTQLVTSGCGNGGGSFPLAVKADSLTGKTEVGASSGSKIYSIGASTTLAEFGYQTYLMDHASGKAPKDTFLANLGILVWVDDFSNTIVYLNDKYAPAVECGKPVIYLYPDKDTRVSVKVGANIRKSEPNYGSGWNVLAKKDGALVLNGATYPYLFWEGKGFGTYPNITNGTVVKQSDAAATISQQLSTMGLNGKEIADFNEFWLPKLPKNPYVRLTWLTNKEMNELAPLQVTPRPDSVLRVFLDFEGLNQPTSIPAQILPKYERKGFTLVEWGGLLKGDQ